MIPFFSFTQVNIGGLTLQVWGIFVAIAVLVAYIYLLKATGEGKYSRSMIHGVVMWALIGAVLGARIAYVFQYPNTYFSHPMKFFAFLDGGMMFMGGLFGTLLFSGVFLYFKKCYLNCFLGLLDIFAFIAPVSIAIGRVGCFMIKDHQGAPTDLPWAIVWPSGVCRHPVALYLILAMVFIFISMIFLRRVVKSPGVLFTWFILLYALSRFLLDFTRSSGTSLSDPHHFGLSTTQWLTAGLVIVTLIILFQYYKMRKRSKNFKNKGNF